jgi:putative membrane protein
MCGFLLRIIINAVLLFLIIVELPGIFVDTLGGMLLGVAIIGLVNATLRPILIRSDYILNWKKTGGVTFVMNVVTSLLVIKLLPGFQIYSMIAPVIGVLLLTICSCTLSKVIQDR